MKSQNPEQKRIDGTAMEFRNHFGHLIYFVPWLIVGHFVPKLHEKGVIWALIAATLITAALVKNHIWWLRHSKLLKADSGSNRIEAVFLILGALFSLASVACIVAVLRGQRLVPELQINWMYFGLFGLCGCLVVTHQFWLKLFYERQLKGGVQNAS